MKFDIHTLPDPLVFGDGDERFSLRLKHITGEERMAILDAAREGSMQLVQNTVQRVVIGWEGVCGADGNPVPFQYQEDSVTKNRLNEFLGAIRIEMQVRVIAGILVYVGIPTDDVEEVVKIFGGSKADLAPTPPPADATPTPASGG